MLLPALQSVEVWGEEGPTASNNASGGWEPASSALEAAAAAASVVAPAPSISREIESVLFDMDELQELLKTVSWPGELG